MKAEQWVVWAFATSPGWEAVARPGNREDAREMVQDMVDEGYPRLWVQIRKADAGPPRKSPSKAEQERVLALEVDF